MMTLCLDWANAGEAKPATRRSMPAAARTRATLRRRLKLAGEWQPDSKGNPPEFFVSVAYKRDRGERRREEAWFVFCDLEAVILCPVATPRSSLRYSGQAGQAGRVRK